MEEKRMGEDQYFCDEQDDNEDMKIELEDEAFSDKED